MSKTRIANESPKVFISYSQDSDEHRERVRALGAGLSRDGCDCRIDVYKDTDEDWPLWMTRQLTEADFILCVVTKTYERRFRDKELPHQGLGVGWEAGLIRRLLYQKKLHNERIFPAFFERRDQQHIPLELQGYDFFLLDRQTGYEALLRKVLKRPAYAKPDTGTQPHLETVTTAPLFARPGEGPSAKGITSRSDISRIVQCAPTRLQHGAEHLVGREEELGNLDKAWDDPKTHVVTIVAWGGVGKTALVVEWMGRMARDGWCGAERVFDWSFYSQGTREQGAASADTFIAAALEFFGGEEGKKLAASPTSGWDKGAKLAQWVAQRRTLLVLDGLEPLQFPPGPLGGKLKDPALEALLKGLAHQNAGLCIVTTREPVADLAPFRDTVSPEWPLEHLSVEAGADLLFRMGMKRAGNAEIKGDDRELKDAAREVGGHALTLQLLGRYLAKVHNGDVRKRSRVAFQKADAKVQGGHAFRTMAAYEKWLSGAGEEGKRQLAVLHLLGLFDRPADGGCITALRKEPAIKGLTEPLVRLDDDDWSFTLSNLVECGLISCREKESTIDCHPLIREHFAKQLREKNPEAWRAAHRRLYEHLCETTTDKKPNPTLEDLQPLYQAIAHGCQAKLQQKAYDNVYSRQIRRGDDYYSAKKLGAFASELVAVACFFEQPWKKLSAPIKESTKSVLLNDAACWLRALGRLTEALKPMRISGEMSVKMEEWTGAAISYNNLSELELTLGEVAGAMRDAELGVTYADRSSSAFLRMRSRTTHANALHQAGRQPEAHTLFRQAELTHRKRKSDRPLLCSVHGYEYCDLLLATSERGAWQMGQKSKVTSKKSELLEACRAVEGRTGQTLKSVTTQKLPLHIGLDHLTLGRAALYKAVLTRSGVRGASSKVNEAVADLRRSGQQDEIPKGLLTRAWLRFLTGARTGPESAQADLDDAWEIAERGPMRLFMADIHLYRARLFGPRKKEIAYPWGSPQADLAAARKLIEQCGYHRRDEELADAEEAAKNW